MRSAERPRGLLVSSYDSDSHRYWREGVVAQFPEIDWTVLSLPARNFSWQARANAMLLTFENSDSLAADYSFLLATAPLDLPYLCSLNPSLAQTPALLYFHENQFEYPRSDSQHSTIELQLASIYSALAAQRLLFNSAYNRTSFLHGVESLLHRAPDKLSEHVLPRLAAKTAVLPVPVEAALTARAPTKEPAASAPGDSKAANEVRLRPPLDIVWNHRWEYDKGPERLLAFAGELQKRKIHAVFHIIGRQFRSQPPAFQQLRELLLQVGSSVRAGHWGRIEQREEYLLRLQQSDLILSTAMHDFQGLAVLEGIACGCLPLVPDRLAYPEFVPERFRYPGAGAIEEEASAAADKLEQLLAAAVPRPAVHAYSWANLRTEYENHIQAALRGC